MNSKRVVQWSLCLILLAGSTDAIGATRRFLVAAGANRGGRDRVELQYAVTDAESFAQIMVEMGGVRGDDRMVLRQPDREALSSAFSTVAQRILNVPPSQGRVEILFYYSGHADERGILMGNDRVSYQELRTLIGAIPAAVRITVLDACASGAITRLKGGQRQPAFLIDDSSAMEGYAFLTSSSPDEAAQESDVIGASYFTHSLVSGLRGAADVSGEGKISLTEAYQFAFNETLSRTSESQGGAQHPSYHINLAGTGDVVMTDVRETSAGLVLDKELRGRFFIRDDDDHLVAELYKPQGRQMTIGLEAGKYKIYMSRDPELWTSRIELHRKEMLVLLPEHFEVTERQPTVVRGGRGAWPPRPGFLGPLAGRSRLELSIGKHGTGIAREVDEFGAVRTSAGSRDLMLGLGYSRWLREDLSLGLKVAVLEGDVSTSVGSTITSSAQGMVALRVGMKKYGPYSMLKTPTRPYLSLGLEALVASVDRTSTGVGGVSTEARSLGAFGVVMGGGVDFLVRHRLMLGADVNYGAVTDFPEPFAGRKNYSGLEASVSFSWLFGKGF